MSHNYDFRSLSPHEFERFCVDLVGAELGLTFETFADGRDQGIDGRCEHEGTMIIVQAKHFRNSSWANLLNAAIHEGEKVRRLNPDRYLFVTSQPLSPQKKDKLTAALNHHSVSRGDVWGQSEINAFLQKHGDVERRNIKLWMSSAKVLRDLLNNHVVVASAATLIDITRTMKVYVATSAVHKALQTLERRHCLIISGSPGAGKTTLSQILAAKYISEGWKLVFINDIEDGWRGFQEHEKQFFLFDDFLGKIGLESDFSGMEQESLNKFIVHVGRSEDKRLILTSRSYILAAAREKSETLDDPRVRLSEQILELGAYSREERGLILYNHLYHSDIDDKAIANLIDSGFIGRIIDHQNYMPRLIEWMTDRLRVSEIPPEDYPSAFINALNNPNKIWEKAFNSHISEHAKVLLFALFASDRFMRFRGAGVPIVQLVPYFDQLLAGFGHGSSGRIGGNSFEKALREINSSFVTVHDGHLNFINPSLQDFLKTQVRDKAILTVLLRESRSYSTTIRLWDIARFMPSDDAVAIASITTYTLKSGQLAGKERVDTFFEFINSLLTRSPDPMLVDNLRDHVCGSLTWDQADLPAFIKELQEGYNPFFPLRDTYARFFCRELYRFLASYPTLAEMALLASNLSEHPIVVSEAFTSHFAQVATNTIENLELPDRDEESARLAEDWLNEIEKIEKYLPLTVDEKKEELDHFIESWRIHRSNLRSYYLYDSKPQPSQTYSFGAEQSLAKVASLFSELKDELER